MRIVVFDQIIVKIIIFKNVFISREFTISNPFVNNVFTYYGRIDAISFN